MSRPVFALAHEGAGRLAPVWLGLRTEEATAGAAGAGAVARHPFATGALALPGGLRVETAVEVEAAVARVHAELRNAGEEPHALTSVVFGFRWEAPNAASLRFLRHGWQSWSLTETRALDAAGEPAFPSGSWLRGLHHAVGDPPADRSGWHESELLTVVGDAAGAAHCLVGAYERGQAFAVVYARAVDGAVELEVEQRVESVLAPGASLRLETLHLALGDEASALLEDYAADYGRRCEARVARPFVSGWCSWYTHFADVHEDDVRRALDALVAVRDEIPVEVVQLDDGYQRAVGDWRETNAKFPRGLAPLAQEIRDAGFVAGLWTAPFCLTPESALAAAQPEWRLADADGPVRALVHPEWSESGVVHALDTARTDVQEHLRALFAELTDWGFHYHKLDFLFAAASPGPVDGLTRAGRLRLGLEAVRAGVGEERFLLGCGSPFGPAVGVVDAMRIGPDVIFEELVDALAAAHAQGYVHRDLKPDNTFLVPRADGKEHVKLLDFGLARHQGSQSVTVTGTSLGTPRYMSPEQFMNSKDLHASTDVWAVGVMLYEMLAGVPPFKADGQHALMLQILTKAHVPLAAAAPDAPAPLVELVERCLVKEPSQRIADARALLAELRVVRSVISPGDAATMIEMPAFDIAPEPASPSREQLHGPTAPMPMTPGPGPGPGPSVASSPGVTSDDALRTKASGPNALRQHLAAANAGAREHATRPARPSTPEHATRPARPANVTPSPDVRTSAPSLDPSAPGVLEVAPKRSRKPLLLLVLVVGAGLFALLVAAAILLYVTWPRTQPVRVVRPDPAPSVLPAPSVTPPVVAPMQPEPGTGPVAHVPAEVAPAEPPPERSPSSPSAQPRTPRTSETAPASEPEHSGEPSENGAPSAWPFDHLPW